MYLFLSEAKFAENSCFRIFPKDCCFYATYFAAIALERLGYEPIYWILGYRESTGAHVWGECDDLVFDLTSGQYPDSPSEYLVYPKRINPNVFHQSFTIGQQGAFDDRFRHDELYFKLFSEVDFFFMTHRLPSLVPSWD
jgi:hypothetical protein